MLKIFPHFRPDLLDWRQVERRDVRERIDLAFHIMDREYGVTRLLDPEGESSAINITTIYTAYLWDETLQHSRKLSHKLPATSYIPHFKHPPCPIYPQFYTFDILTNRRPVFAASSMMTVCHFYIWSEGGNRRLGVGLVVAGTCGHQGKGGSWPEPEIPAASCQHTFILMLNCSCLSVRSLQFAGQK